MAADDEFAHWAALFVGGYREGGTAADLVQPPTPIISGIEYLGITPAACELLRAVDAGGVPAFVTGSLKQIATDNGIDVSPQWTPNEIIAAIRAQATKSDSLPSAPSG